MTAAPIPFFLVMPDDTPAMVDPADRSDIHASIQGDGDAYARLIRRHQQRIASRMRRFTRDRTTLEELVHDVFVQAYLSLRRYRGDAPFDHWLSTIATRVGYRYWKQQSSRRTTDLTGSEPAPPSPSSGNALEGVLEQLSPRDRLVITLLYLEERSVAETASLTGWSQSMVKVQAFRARGRLKKIMRQHGDRS